MAYNPRQLRGPDGRWISNGLSGKKVTRAARSKANKKAYAKARQRRKAPPIKITTAAGRQARCVGVEGLRKNFIPYARVSKRSATVGANTGTFIPFTDKRIAFGSYFRFEDVKKKTGVDKLLSKAYESIAPKGSARALVGEHIRKNVKIDNPAIRYSTPGTGSREGVQFRLGTSRKSGPTLVVRRGSHKRTRTQSKAGIKKYDTRMRALSGTKVSKPRPTRRRQAANRKKRR